MDDVISREEMRTKLVRMKDRVRQRRDGSYKVGYEDACKDSMQKLFECASLEVVAVTRCRECRHAVENYTTQPFCTIRNRRCSPDDYCNHGEREEM